MSLVGIVSLRLFLLDINVLPHKPPAADFMQISIYITPEDWTEVVFFNLREDRKKKSNSEHLE